MRTCYILLNYGYIRWMFRLECSFIHEPYLRAKQALYGLVSSVVVELSTAMKYNPALKDRQVGNCHAERSEASRSPPSEILRFAQDDKVCYRRFIGPRWLTIFLLIEHSKQIVQRFR